MVHNKILWSYDKILLKMDIKKRNIDRVINYFYKIVALLATFTKNNIF